MNAKTNVNDKIAFGGGCHWCTEAIFQSLLGVMEVMQGHVASTGIAEGFSEAVIVHFNSDLISLDHLIDIHLYTHKSASNHSMRSKYRSAIYTFTEVQSNFAKQVLRDRQSEFHPKLITEVLLFGSFKPSRAAFRNYYYNQPQKPFCERYIQPKLRLLLDKYADKVNREKVLPSTTCNSNP